MSHIVGLDLSLTSTGIAALSTSPPAVKVCGDVAPVLLRSVGEDGRRDDSYQVRSRRVRRQCAAIMRTLDDADILGDIALAVIEGPIYAGKMLPSYFDRAILFGGVFGALDAAGVPIVVVPSTTGHQFVTGKGHAQKADIVAEVKTWWPELRVHNDDEADALGYAVMGAMHLGFNLPFRPWTRHHNAVHTVCWPKLRGSDG